MGSKLANLNLREPNFKLLFKVQELVEDSDIGQLSNTPDLKRCADSQKTPPIMTAQNTPRRPINNERVQNAWVNYMKVAFESMVSMQEPPHHALTAGYNFKTMFPDDIHVHERVYPFLAAKISVYVGLDVTGTAKGTTRYIRDGLVF
ncbi:hypothetical protein C8R44DRAFT_746018 [Mycena epipterygia]|nr:hypothetical protein C8R44DRAFT_746018 [Mycena epipterygia]